MTLKWAGVSSWAKPFVIEGSSKSDAFWALEKNHWRVSEAVLGKDMTMGSGQRASRAKHWWDVRELNLRAEKAASKVAPKESGHLSDH